LGATLPHELDWLLDDIERERAARFRHEADRRSYVLAHALRRAVLARWLAADPCDICFSHEPGGRPELRGLSDRGVYFSHSRSRDAVACAVTSVAPIGIDVEAVRAGGADEAMIARFIVPAEGDGLAPDERDSRFYFYWTALEAFWKAEGKGLADANPRIELREDTRGHLQVWLEGDARGPRARLLPVQHSRGAWTMLAIGSAAELRWQLFNANKQLVNGLAAHEMLSPR
jgi:phosphopantetheinyl transferase